MSRSNRREFCVKPGVDTERQSFRHDELLRLPVAIEVDFQFVLSSDWLNLSAMDRHKPDPYADQVVVAVPVMPVLQALFLIYVDNKVRLTQNPFHIVLIA